MPLLKKKPFKKSVIPDFLRDDEEIFYCEFTDEIFRDYDEYSERMFLYNSMVWTCSMTGKSNLTYQEALESEENAKRNLKEFSLELRLPLLFLASKTQRSSFGEMAEDVFMFMKERYFIGENLETSFTGSKWKESHVLQVIAPQECLTKSPPKNGAKNNVDRQFWPLASQFKYEIEHLDADDNDISEIMIVDFNQIRRKKTVFSREKCKLFLKQYVEQDSNGMFVIKPSVIEDFGIGKIKFDQIFDGPLPYFEVSKKKVQNGKKQKQETLAKFLTKGIKLAQASIINKKNCDTNLLEQMKKREEEFKIQKQLKEEERLIIKKRQKDEYIKINNHIRDWSKPKEDLILEDQKVLPEPTPVKTKIPSKFFGDVIMILDFVDTFSKLLSTKDFFPGGLTMEIMERAVTENEIAGPFTDMIQMLLTALFNVQDEESSQYRTAIENATSIKEDELADNLSLSDATRLATLAFTWSNKYQGLPLGRLPLYSVTVSEILRLHLLSSGARINETGARWRYAQRGGYTSEADPGLYLRLYQPHILKALAVQNVVQLSLEDKLKIVECLISQLLTYADVRDLVEEKLEKTRQWKLDVRVLQTNEKKCEQEYLANKLKVKKEMKGDPKLKDVLDNLERNYEKKHADILKKINNLLKNIYNLQTVLGSDRAYRKYLRVDSVPGFFVCWDEEIPGECLSEISKQNPDLLNASRQRLLDHFRKIVRATKTNDKENKINSSPVKLNGSVNDAHSNDVDISSIYMCSTDPETCVVHSIKSKDKQWSFFHNRYQLDELEKALNKRGIREGELLQMIKHDKDRLIDVIEQCPVNILNPDIEIPEDEQRITKPKKNSKDRYEDANLGYPAEMTTEDILETSLLDNILEMEEKIYAGGLGGLSIKSRDEWRQCLANKNYNEMDTSIKRDKIKKIKKEDRDDKSRSATPELPVKSEPEKYLDPGKYLGPTVVSEATSEDVLQSESLQRSISSLGMALAQVAYAVDSKYLKKPLGHADITKNEKKQDYDLLDKWEQSLLASTSYSQVFLHYGTLDSCVMWSRSALLARCRICRRQKDSENMLLCDHCNLGHHLYCLKPKLTVVPKGDWFCDKCKKEKEKEAKLLNSELVPAKKRRIFQDEDVEEEESIGEEEEDVDMDEEIELDEENRLCKSCRSGGELISCEKCNVAYHIECYEPPLRRVPRGAWHCHSCKEQIEAKQKRRYSDSSDEMVVHTRRSNRRDDLPLHNAALQELLSETLKHKDAWPFVKPVQKNEVPDYYDVITKPMDFGTIKYKLNMGEYTEDSNLMADVILVFENCNTYNDSDAEVYKCGVRLLRYFAKKATDLGLKLPEELEIEEQPLSKKSRTK